jgi:hypothetical protein
MNPFEVAGELSTSTRDNWSEIGDKGYNAFMINRAFSYHLDTIMIADIQNKQHLAPAKWQYDFYLNGITPKRKRFAKWHKPEKDDFITEVMVAYKINRQRAVQYIALMGAEGKKDFKKYTNIGGR